MTYGPFKLTQTRGSSFSTMEVVLSVEVLSVFIQVVRMGIPARLTTSM
jgi:hypothetical protein